MKLDTLLIKWYLENKRDLPWRHTKDPYIIWVSEIILQQTRVIQGIDYFHRFVHAFPDIESLANADEDAVLKLWQGLGYYSRARNMHASAKQIMDLHGGIFPESHSEILKLKGIGTYTAAAIASFAFDQSFPVLDGNVFRFLARYFNIDIPINSPEGKKIFYETVSNCIDKQNPALFNQAIMEFGALQCKPVSPDCSICPLNQSCLARKKNTVDLLPVKIKNKVPKIRHFNYLLIQQGSFIYLKQRTDKDIWKNLYDFPLIETTEKQDAQSLVQEPAWIDILQKRKWSLDPNPVCMEHQLTHQSIKALFWRVHVLEKKELPIMRIAKDQLHTYPISRLLEKYLEKNSDGLLCI